MDDKIAAAVQAALRVKTEAANLIARVADISAGNPSVDTSQWQAALDTLAASLNSIADQLAATRPTSTPVSTPTAPVLPGTGV